MVLPVVLVLPNSYMQQVSHRSRTATERNDQCLRTEVASDPDRPASHHQLEVDFPTADILIYRIYCIHLTLRSRDDFLISSQQRDADIFWQILDKLLHSPASVPAS